MWDLQIYLFTCLFIYFWLCWVFVAAQSFLQLQRVGATLQLRWVGFLLWFAVPSLVAEQEFQGVQLPASRIQAQQMWWVGSVALEHMGSLQERIMEWVAISFSREFSQSEDETCVSCIGTLSLSHQGSPSVSFWGKVQILEERNLQNQHSSIYSLRPLIKKESL